MLFSTARWEHSAATPKPDDWKDHLPGIRRRLVGFDAEFHVNQPESVLRTAIKDRYAQLDHGGQSILVYWVSKRAMHFAADLLLDFAEGGDETIAISASTTLFFQPSPLIETDDNIRRIRELRNSAPHLMARMNWEDILKRIDPAESRPGPSGK
ncbi:MAG TPA: hypothetical protein VEI02_02875 [Planctomycetota bacterium]|nr:hypothetical protein [Planctomycetota bacterium]